MNLQLLKNGTPDEKKWLDIVCYDIKCNSITPNVPFVTVSDKIESNDLSSSITCNDIGIGGGGMSAIGNIDMNLNLLRNVGAIDTSDPTLNIITPTTQIINGSSEIKLDVDSVDRVVLDNTKTALYSKSAAIGPSGSFLLLNDNSSFSLGSYFGGNGSVECSANSLALVGPQAKSLLDLTDATITTELFNGVARVGREIMDSMGQVFKDGNQVEQLRLDTSGVTIGNSYTMPTSDGLANQYIYTNGAGVCSWASPAAINPFNQNLNTSDSVQFINVNVNGLYTFPTVAGTLNYVIASDGLGGTSWQPVSALTAGVTVTFGGSVSIINNFFRYDATYLASVVSAPDQVGNVFVAPVALTGVSLSWDTSSGNNTTTLDIYKNNVSTGNIVLTGIRGVISSLPISFAVGDTCQLRYVAGTAPGNAQVTLYFT